MKKTILYTTLFATTAMMSCGGEETKTSNTTKKDTISKDSVLVKESANEEITIDTIFPQPKSKALEKWKSLEEVHRDWTKLERDEKGYLIYEASSYKTPAIKIDGAVTITMPNGEEIRLSIDKFTRVTGNKGLYIYAASKDATGEFDVAIKDGENKLVFWDFYIKKGSEKKSYKWVMTPTNHAQEFRKIIVKGDEELKTNFLPIEFE